MNTLTVLLLTFLIQLLAPVKHAILTVKLAMMGSMPVLLAQMANLDRENIAEINVLMDTSKTT